MSKTVFSYVAAYAAVAALTAFVCGIRSALKNRDDSAIPANILVGLFWPWLLLAAACSWLARGFSWACVRCADAIDRFNAEEAKKRIDKGEGRIGGK